MRPAVFLGLLARAHVSGGNVWRRRRGAKAAHASPPRLAQYICCKMWRECRLAPDSSLSVPLSLSLSLFRLSLFDRYVHVN